MGHFAGCMAQWLNSIGVNAFSPADEMVDKYSMENHVTSDNPPTLLIHASDDKAVSPMNSVNHGQSQRRRHVINV